MPENEPGQHRDELSPKRPARQLELPATDATQYRNDVRWLYVVAGEMVRIAGGTDWLAHAMDREPSYGSKIREALAGTGERKFHLEMLAPLLRDTEAAEHLLSRLSELLDFEPPVRVKRETTPEQEAKAHREAIDELDPDMRDLMRRKVARKLGVRVEDLKP